MTNRAITKLETTDREIREVLREFVRHEHADASDTLFIEELALHGGDTRADLAALNGVSHGYEIKSSRDTLSRLPRQVDAYNAVFERVTLVGAERHLVEACSLIPAWWGIVSVRCTLAGIHLTRTRLSQLNPSPDPKAIAALLWRPEALQILTLLGLDAGVRSKPMTQLIERLTKAMSPERLSCLVRQALRARGDWRAAARRKRCDGRFRPHANQWGFRRAPYGNKHL